MEEKENKYIWDLLERLDNYKGENEGLNENISNAMRTYTLLYSAIINNNTLCSIENYNKYIYEKFINLKNNSNNCYIYSSLNQVLIEEYKNNLNKLVELLLEKNYKYKGPDIAKYE